MKIIFEFASTFLYACFEFIDAIVSIVVQNLPTIIKLKSIASYFTPLGAFAVILGVPLCVLTICRLIVKHIVRN